MVTWWRCGTAPAESGALEQIAVQISDVLDMLDSFVFTSPLVGLFFVLLVGLEIEDEKLGGRVRKP